MLLTVWRWLLALPWLLRCGWCIAVLSFWLYACLAPASDASALALNDKVAHIIGNFGVAGVLYIAGWPRRWWLLALVVLGFSLAIELVQALLPSRYFSLADMLANGVGISLAIALMAYLCGCDKRQSAPSDTLLDSEC